MENDLTQIRFLDFLGPHQTIETGVFGVNLLVARLNKGAFDPGLFDIAGVDLPEGLHGAIDKRRAEFLAGRALAHRALDALGHPHVQIPIGPNRAPIWPKGIQGAISHTNDWCAVILTNQPDLYLGVDVEVNLTQDAMKSVSRVVLNQDEESTISNADIPRNAALAAAFSGKETLYKGLYPLVGKFFGFDAARLIQFTGDGHIQFELTRDLADSLLKGQKHTVQLLRFEKHVLTWHIHKTG